MKGRQNLVLYQSPAVLALSLALMAGGWACRQGGRAAGAEADATTAAAEARRPILRRDAFFGLHFDLHPNAQDTVLGADVSAENIAALLDRVRPDYVQYDCKGHPGYAGYPTRVGWPAPGIVKDSLAVWRKATKDRGIGLFIHYSGVWDTKAVTEHPEWARIDAQGKVDKDKTSVFGPYVDRLLIPQLKEVSAAYDLDGAWVDGECWAADYDYSPAALAAWRQKTGYAAAPKSSADPHWFEWKMFQRQAFEDYLTHWVDAIHAFNPKFQITSNWMYTSFIPKPVTIKLDFLSGDYSPSMSVDRARYEARYLASTGMPWDLMAWGFDRSKDATWSLKTPVQLRQEAAVVLMQGGGFQVYNTPTRSGYITPAIVDQLGPVADFCRARQALSQKSRTVPQVALLLSETSLWEKMERLYMPGAEFDELEGALHALLELHYSVDILAEHQLGPRLKEFPLVVIPNAQKLSPEFQEAAVRYVEDGGSLLLLGEKSARLFEPQLGAGLAGGPKETPAELATPAGPVSVPGMWQAVTPGTAETMGLRYPTRDFRGAGEPAATVAAFGKGKIAAVYGPFSLGFLRGHHPGLRQWLGGLTARLFADPAVIVEAPPTVDIALRRTADGRLTVHALNRTGFPVPDRYNFTDFVPPVGPLEVRLKVAVRPKSVRWLPEGGELKWSWKDGVLKTTVPSVHIHGIVVVD
jgi:hypothetical protein